MARKRPSHRTPSSRRKQKPRYNAPSSSGETLITRRNFLYGAIGVGALAVIAGGSTVAANAFSSEPEENLSALQVPTSAVSALADTFSQVSATDHVSLLGEYELPYGTLVWTNNDKIAACLFPNETSKPLTKIGLLFLENGQYSTVQDQAVGQSEGFDIYDVRASEQGVIWTEANILSNTWRIYSATWDGNILGLPTKIDEGDANWETPTLAAIGSYAFWQVLPSLTGMYATSDSLLKCVRFGQTTSETIYSSTGRMCSPPYALGDSLVITPRTKTESVNYQMTLIDAASREIKDKLVLPQSMRPLEAGYGNTGFHFIFDAGYDYGGGIAAIGTYAPLEKVTSDYSSAPWFRFGRTPTAPPAWCKQYFIVKSQTAICGIDFATKTYFLLDTLNGSDTYGDYLASTGMNNTFVAYANVDNKPIGKDPVKNCFVRVWQTLT